jgi:hypothetical protein
MANARDALEAAPRMEMTVLNDKKNDQDDKGLSSYTNNRTEAATNPEMLKTTMNVSRIHV